MSTNVEVYKGSDTVSLPITVEEAVQQWQEYQRLTTLLLNESDYQSIGKKRFKKKSAWRKYAKAFNITDRVTFEEVHRAEDGFPLWARIRVEARATNGRCAEADHECHTNERCCPASSGMKCGKATWKNHDCCLPNCSGRMHWSHPGDIPATALTRAKNRAISDLIGAGEVSAEEVIGQKPTEEPQDAGEGERASNGPGGASTPQERAKRTEPAPDGAPVKAKLLGKEQRYCDRCAMIVEVRHFQKGEQEWWAHLDEPTKEWHNFELDARPGNDEELFE